MLKLEERLIDFRPRWFTSGNNRRDGITMLCPCCRRHRLAIYFDRDLFTNQMVNDKNVRAEVEGDSFVNLKFSYKVDDHQCEPYLLVVDNNVAKMEEA